MPLFGKKEIQGAVIGIWKMTETQEELCQLLADPILEEEAAFFPSSKRRLEFLTIRVLLKELFSEKMKIDYESTGKPYLVDSLRQISITHTKGYAAVILHPFLPVSIDLEKRADKVLSLQPKFMNEQELIHIDSSDPLSYALLCWSAKESLFKILSEEGIDFKHQLHLAPFQVCPTGQMQAYETRTGRQTQFYVNFEVCSDYVLTWIIG